MILFGQNRQVQSLCLYITRITLLHRNLAGVCSILKYAICGTMLMIYEFRKYSEEISQ